MDPRGGAFHPTVTLPLCSGKPQVSLRLVCHHAGEAFQPHACVRPFTAPRGRHAAPCQGRREPLAEVRYPLRLNQQVYWNHPDYRPCWKTHYAANIERSHERCSSVADANRCVPVFSCLSPLATHQGFPRQSLVRVVKREFPGGQGSYLPLPGHLFRRFGVETERIYPPPSPADTGLRECLRTMVEGASRISHRVPRSTGAHYAQDRG